MWDSDALDVVACAGTQGGKSRLQPEWLLREVQRCAPLIRMMRSGKFIYAGPTLTLLSAQVIPKFREIFQEQEQLGRLMEGNKPAFKFSPAGLQKVLGFSDCPVTIHFAYTNDSSNLESMTAFGGAWDESGQKENKQDSYGAYNRRLKLARSTTFASVAEYAPDWWKEWYGDLEGPAATFGRRLWGTTPYEWNWFKTEVVDRAEAGQEGFGLYNWPSWENPLVSELECRAELTKGMALWQWEMMYLGQYTRPAGAIYDTFDWGLDTCEAFPIPPTWKVYPGVDFGSVHMGAVIIAEDPTTKTLYVVDEYLAGNRSFSEHAAAIRKNYTLQVGAGGSHQEEGWREAFRTNGLPLDEPPVSSVEVGIGCVYQQVKTHSLKIFRSCSGTTGEMQLYSRELGADGHPSETIKNKSEYHRVDALRYIISKLRPPTAVSSSYQYTYRGAKR